MVKIKHIRLAGLNIIIIYIIMSVVFFAKMRTTTVANPVVAFEFVNSKEDVAQIFSTSPDVISVTLIKAVDAFNKVDFIFAVAYSMFLSLFFIRLKDITDKKIFFVPVILSFVAMIFDFAENTQLLKIASEFLSHNDFDANLKLLKIFTWTKWSSLTLTLLSGAFYLQKKSIAGKLLSIICTFPTTLLLLSIYDTKFSIAFATSVVIGIVAMIIYAFLPKKINALT